MFGKCVHHYSFLREAPATRGLWSFSKSAFQRHRKACDTGGCWKGFGLLTLQVRTGLPGQL